MSTSMEIEMDTVKKTDTRMRDNTRMTTDTPMKTGTSMSTNTRMEKAEEKEIDPPPKPTRKATSKSQRSGTGTNIGGEIARLPRSKRQRAKSNESSQNHQVGDNQKKRLSERGRRRKSR